VVVPVTLVDSAPDHSLTVILSATTKSGTADTIFPHSEVQYFSIQFLLQNLNFLISL
jgi:hypothetical protein